MRLHGQQDRHPGVVSVLDDDETPAEELLAAMTAPLPSLAELMPGAPPNLVELIDRAVAFDRSQRWPSAAAMHGPP